MDRYGDLDLECDGGDVAGKGGVFKGRFKKTPKLSKEAQPPQLTFLQQNQEISTSNDSLDGKSSKYREKEKLEGSKENLAEKHKSKQSGFSALMNTLSFDKQGKDNTDVDVEETLDNAENQASHKQSKLAGVMAKLNPFKNENKEEKQSESSDEDTPASTDKTSSHKQVTLLQQNQDISASNDSLDGKSSKDKSSMLGGIFKRPYKKGHARRPSQDLLDIDLSASNNNDNESTKEPADIFKKSPKPLKEKTKSQDNLTVDNEVSANSDSLTEKTAKVTLLQQNQDISASNDSLDGKSSKDKSSMLGGIFKRPYKKGHARRPSQDLLDIDLSASNNNDNESTKEPADIFKKSPKPLKEKTKSQDNLTVDNEVSANSDSLTEKTAKYREKEKLEGSKENLAEKHKSKQSGFSALMNTLSFDKQGKDNTDVDVEETLDNAENQASHKQSKLAGVMAKLNPFKNENKEEKQSESSDEDTPASTDKTSSHKQKEPKDTDTLKGAEKQMEGKPKALKNVDGESYHRSEIPPVPPRRTPKEKSGTPVQEKGKTKSSEGAQEEKLSGSKENLTDKPKVRQKGFSAMMKSTFYSDKQENADVGETLDKAENQASHKQSKFAEAMNIMNPFKYAQKDKPSDSSDEDAATDKSSSHKQANKDVLSGKKPDKEAPTIPSQKPLKKELRNRAANACVQEDQQQSQSDEEILKDKATRQRGDEVTPAESKPNKKKTKHLNPLLQAAAQPPSDDEGLKDQTEKGDESRQELEMDGTNKPEEVKVKKPKRHNPFMPRVKAKVTQRRTHEEENEGVNLPLFERLDEFRVDSPQPEDVQDMNDLMEWWKTVESWEDTPQDEDMTEKEEAKAFAVTADKVQKGIRVFNKLFSERAESLWDHVIELRSIADTLDKFSKNTKIAQITGGSTSAIGGVATITGLALAPVTFGTSLIVTAVGLGVAAAGGLTSAGAGISNQVNNSLDRKKVEKIVKDYEQKMVDLNKCLLFIKQGIENLRRFDLIKMKNNAYNRDFPALTSSFYEDGAMAGKAILINANEIMRVVQIANVAGSTAARAVQIASMATGVLTGLFVAMDIYFVTKDSKELKKGAKSEFASKIREVASQLHDGLVELNTIRDELKGTTPQDNQEDNQEDKKKYDYDVPEEDEIDRIKKAYKKDLDNREYV
ncbi:biorientation of chromosomes in cell division protein 1-like 1 isoform X2 [Nerophis ophidion]|uniref:biorientation of chromosomes in cell division protein 1-like 1 isoform X2 n=1 Tax=Nerophis ophidion TaxID=159077 RepID=UPI002ADF2913|nr:biorientation of chromosomes in cell division protein 1-like 1 isoform X2 [Nerophis ophidion]